MCSSAVYMHTAWDAPRVDYYEYRTIVALIEFHMRPSLSSHPLLLLFSADPWRASGFVMCSLLPSPNSSSGGPSTSTATAPAYGGSASLGWPLAAGAPKPFPSMAALAVSISWLLLGLPTLSSTR